MKWLKIYPTLWGFQDGLDSKSWTWSARQSQGNRKTKPIGMCDIWHVALWLEEQRGQRIDTATLWWWKRNEEGQGRGCEVKKKNAHGWIVEDDRRPFRARSQSDSGQVPPTRPAQVAAAGVRSSHTHLQRSTAQTAAQPQASKAT